MADDRDMTALVDSVADRGLDRIREMLRLRAAGGRPAQRAPLQWPDRLFVPGLRAEPWHDPRAFPWAAQFERSADAIRGELERALDEGTIQPYAEAESWGACFLFRHGEWVEPNAALCPRTRALLEGTPMGVGEALFSVLEAGAEIGLHSGGCNAVLTCHLGLVVPDGCTLTVGGASRTLEAGSLLLFDDSFAHAAWNDSDRRRVCLLWEVWHPDLTDVEVAALERLFPLLMGDE